MNYGILWIWYGVNVKIQIHTRMFDWEQQSENHASCHSEYMDVGFFFGQILTFVLHIHSKCFTGEEKCLENPLLLYTNNHWLGTYLSIEYINILDIHYIHKINK